MSDIERHAQIRISGAPPASVGEKLRMHRQTFRRRTSSHLETAGRSLWRQVIVSTVLAFETSSRAIEQLLNAEGEEQSTLTRRWRDYKLEELRFVGITAALIASLFGGAFSWYNAAGAVWEVLALWYCGLLFTIASLSSATQQAVTLYRFSAMVDGEQMIRNFLRRERADEGRWKPRLVQVYVWQVPVMLLRFSIFLFLIGLLVLLWTSAKIHANGNGVAVAAIFTGICGMALINHWFCMASIYSRISR